MVLSNEAGMPYKQYKMITPVFKTRLHGHPSGEFLLPRGKRLPKIAYKSSAMHKAAVLRGTISVLWLIPSRYYDIFSPSRMQRQRGIKHYSSHYRKRSEHSTVGRPRKGFQDAHGNNQCTFSDMNCFFSSFLHRKSFCLKGHWSCAISLTKSVAQKREKGVANWILLKLKHAAD